MRFIIMHKTNPIFEAGARPDADVIARVGDMIGGMVRAGVFQSGEGLGPSSSGVRLRFTGGVRNVIQGPLVGENELPAAFSIVRSRTLDDAIAWATKAAAAFGDVELDIRPVNEPWDIGIGEKPPGLDTRRYMVLRKATVASEAEADLPGPQQSSFHQLIQETTRSGVHLTTETMRPSARGRRYLNTSQGISVFDGPFVESKELLGGSAIVSGASLDDVDRWAREYIAAVGPHEVDLRELV